MLSIRVARIYCCIIALVFACQQAFAQYLQAEISYKATGTTSLRDALAQISDNRDFFFSYSGTAVDGGVRVPVEAYDGTVGGFLSLALGPAYEFKETPGYIIIRFAPRTMEVEMDVEKSGRHSTVKGKLTDFNTKEPVPFASIYERNLLVSTLTNQEGYFELKVRQSQALFWLTFTKENYRDTSLYILPEIDIKARKISPRLRFAPENGNAEALEENFLGRIFIGVRQRMQRINLGGFLGESPYQVSLIPGIGSQGMFGSQTVNRFSLNLIGGYSAGTEGFETAGVFNINQHDSYGFQSAGMANMVGGQMRGMQTAGLFNTVYGDFTGLQAAGLYNHTGLSTKGVQVAGIYNRSKTAAQHQLSGLANRSGQVPGVQLSGLFNAVDSAAGGLQVTGGINIAKLSANHQLAGLANRSREVKGLQVAGLFNSASQGQVQVAGLFNASAGSVHSQVAGIFNKATKVTGFQFGLLNLAESSDYPIGLVNWIKNGRKSLSLSYDESAVRQLTLRTGGQKSYSLLGIGTNTFAPQSSYAVDIGFGLSLMDKGRINLDTELATRMIFRSEREMDYTNALRLLPAIQLYKSIRLYAGPSLNFAIWDYHPEKKFPGWVFHRSSNTSNLYGLFGGLIGGIQVVF